MSKRCIYAPISQMLFVFLSILFLKDTFIYLWLWWVLVVAHRLCLAMADRLLLLFGL